MPEATGSGLGRTTYSDLSLWSRGSWSEMGMWTHCRLGGGWAGPLVTLTALCAKKVSAEGQLKIVKNC